MCVCVCVRNCFILKTRTLWMQGWRQRWRATGNAFPAGAFHTYWKVLRKTTTTTTTQKQFTHRNKAEHCWTQQKQKIILAGQTSTLVGLEHEWKSTDVLVAVRGCTLSVISSSVLQLQRKHYNSKLESIQFALSNLFTLILNNWLTDNDLNQIIWLINNTFFFF